MIELMLLVVSVVIIPLGYLRAIRVNPRWKVDQGLFICRILELIVIELLFVIIGICL